MLGWGMGDGRWEVGGRMGWWLFRRVFGCLGIRGIFLEDFDVLVLWVD